jgi:hypothetical protein
MTMPDEEQPNFEAECSSHRAAMEEMVRRAIQFQEIRDDDLEQASLEALAKRLP